MKKRHALIISLLTALIFLGCNPEAELVTTDDNTTASEDTSGNSNGNESGSGGSTQNTTFGYLDITDAEELFISDSILVSSSRSVARSASGSNRLYKMKDGKIKEVEAKNTNKEEITLNKTPTKVININNDYTMIVYGADQNNPSEAYIIRKNDGAVFSLSGVNLPIYPCGYCFKNQPWITCDDNNNVYYYGSFFVDYGGYRNIVKVNLSDPNNITAENISPSTDGVYYFFVDDNNNILYESLVIANNIEKHALIKSNGGLKNISDVKTFWKAPDGYIYYSYSSGIKKIDVDLNYEVNLIDYSSFTSDFSSSYLLTLDNKVYIVGKNGTISEVYNSTETPRAVTLTGLSITTVTNADSTDNYYYISGTDDSGDSHLIRVNPSTDNYIELFTVGEYDVYSFTASETDGITFNALRMSDGKKIVGTVGIDGTNLTIIDEESDFQVTNLTRIK